MSGSNIPYVPLVEIFSYLNVKEKIKCTAVCKAWRDIILSPPLWKDVYPTQWTYDLWESRSRAHPRIQEKMDKNSRYNRAWMNTSCFTRLGGHVGDEVIAAAVDPCGLNLVKDVIKECKIISGFIEYVLPHVGSGVQMCVLATSNVVQDFLLNIILLSCPNLVHLNVSYTGVADTAFYRLWRHDACVNIQYLDFTCCYQLTDKSISNLVQCWNLREEANLEKIEEDLCQQFVVLPAVYCEIIQACCNLIYLDNMDKGGLQWVVTPEGNNQSISVPCHAANKTRRLAGLRYLNLSGCTKLTDESLHSLATCKAALRTLEFLDVSGNCRFTSKGLRALVDSCPSLKPENLYYCGSLKNGPFVSEANGCSNLQSSTRPCCTPAE